MRAPSPVYFAVVSFLLFFFSSRRRHTRSLCDWSSDVCSSDLAAAHDDAESRWRIGEILYARRVLHRVLSADRERRRRSEERRVGKEWRSRWSLDQYKKKRTMSSGAMELGKNTE